MPSPFMPPRPSSSEFFDPPAGLLSGAFSPIEARALALIWERETSLFERAWLARLCAQGERESALSWLCRDEALADIFGLCPSNAPGRVWDRLARASGLRQVQGGRADRADERCQRLARAAGAHHLFPPERRERLRRALWRQAREDLAAAGPLAPPGCERLLPWPPPADRLEIWFGACRARADQTRSGPELERALLAREALDRAGFGSGAL